MLGYYPQKPVEQPGEVTPLHAARRRTWSEWMQNRSANWCKNLISVDEVPFTVDGGVNHQTHRYPET